MKPATETTLALERAVREAGKHLAAFPHHANGLTPDTVKALPEWQEAKRASVAAFAALREHNAQRMKG